MELRDYQIEIAELSAKKLRYNKIVYLAMQTRTGKTHTALSTAELLKAKKVLFVTKKKAIPSIMSDYQDKYSFDLTCINYESLHKIDGSFDLIIADEAHTLGAFPKPSKRTKELKRHVGSRPIMYLSATPSPESYSQLYHQFYVSDNSPFHRYYNFYKWAHDFVIKEKKYVYNKEFWDYSNAKKKDVFAEVGHLFITKTQEEAGFKVAIQEEVLTCKMDGQVSKMIRSIKSDRVYIDMGYEVVADTAVKVMQKIHQLCGGTVIDEGGYKIVSYTKAQFIYERFKNKHLAIFYMYKSECEVLKKVFHNWTEDFTEFQKTGGVFLGQFRSAREGIRLDRAEAIIFYNIDFSFLSYEQAKNRIVSHERDKKAVLYWIFTHGGIESRIYNVVKNKGDYTLSHYRKDHDRIAVRTEMEQEGSQQRLDFR